jgi:hypothetical protein
MLDRAHFRNREDGGINKKTGIKESQKQQDTGYCCF